MTKIAIIASTIHPIKQRHLLEWYDDFSYQNHDMQLFLGSKVKEIPSAKNYKVNAKSEKLKYTVSNIFHLKQKARDLKKIQPLINYKPGIIHLLTSIAFLNIEPILRDVSIKLIVSFRGYDINVFPNLSEENKKLTRRIFQRADKLHFVSKNLKNKAICLGADPGKCVVIYRSIRVIPMDSLDYSYRNMGRFKIFSVGRLVWEKGYLYALEAMALLKSKGYDFEYQIAGKGPDYNMLHYHINRLKIQDRVRLLGELTEEEVCERLLMADVFLQSSVLEGVPNSIFEALYHKLPIVSSNVGGIPEVVQDNITGFLSEPCNPSAYVDNIIKLMEDADLRKKMGEEGYRRIKENFSREKEIENWKGLYKSLGIN